MTIIYGDVLFFLNALLDYLLLLGAARLVGEPLRRGRFLLGALLGGGYALAIFVPGLEFLSHPLCRVAAGGMMALTAYGNSPRFLRQTALFFGLSCALGGSVLAIGLLGRQGLSLSGGVLYSGMDLKIVLLAAALCYGVLTVAFQRMGRHSALAGEILTVRLTLEERTVELPVLVDTGNTLSDPVTGCPVLVAESTSLADLFPPHGIEPETLRDPLEALTQLGVGRWGGRFRLLPYRAVGVEQGFLLAFRADSVWIRGQKRDILVALSPTPVSDGGGYRGLVGV